jgi:glycosyltransferase involved in cell wall biosynthesis
MRILHVINHLSNSGNGIVNLAIDLGIEQVKAGHTVAFVSGHGGHEKLLQQFGIAYYYLDQTQSPRKLLAAFFGFKDAVAAFQPDIIHAHMRVGLLIGWVWSRIKRIPLVGHLHNVHDRESLLMGLADRVIAVSSSVRTSIRKQGVPDSKIRVVLNGTLKSERLPRRDTAQPVSLQRPSITTVAGMNMRKGIEELIAAFNLVAPDYPNAHLYLVGDGPDRKTFEQQAAQSPHRDRIHFEGFQSDPRAYMLASDIFVLASRRESFGLVLTEAREAGCAIIATDVDGIPEALEGGHAGILVRPRDPAGLAAALSLLLGDEELRRDWQRKARQNTEHFTAARMAQEVEQVYCELTPTVRVREQAPGQARELQPWPSCSTAVQVRMNSADRKDLPYEKPSGK